MSGGFQTQVYSGQAPAVAGDFASTNPRFNYLAGPGGLIAGSNGLTIGRFAWVSNSVMDADSAPAVASNVGVGPVAGFVGRTQQALITTFLADGTQTIPSGYPVTLFTGGDFWVKNEGTTQALPGQYAYASFANGAVNFAAASSAATASGSTSSVAASTFSVTGSISGNTLTVTAVSSGTIYAGATISGTGIATGTQIVSQVSGTTGGVGVYSVSIGEQTAASTTVSGTYGTLTVGGTVTGTFVVGGTLSGSGVTAGTQLTAFISGTGGAGTYVVNNNTVVSSTAISSTTNVQTKWIAVSGGLAGELVKVTSFVLG